MAESPPIRHGEFASVNQSAQRLAAGPLQSCGRRIGGLAGVVALLVSMRFGYAANRLQISIVNPAWLSV
jgi:hypothetical protein